MASRVMRLCIVSALLLAMTTPSLAEPESQPANPETGTERKLPRKGEQSLSGEKNRGQGSWIPTILIVCGGLAFLIYWQRSRKSGGIAARGGLPTDVLQLLGRAALDAKHQVQLLRCGDRILVIGISTEGLRTLAEITDADEIARIETACGSETHPGLPMNAFRNLFRAKTSKREAA